MSTENENSGSQSKDEILEEKDEQESPDTPANEGVALSNDDSQK